MYRKQIKSCYGLRLFICWCHHQLAKVTLIKKTRLVTKGQVAMQWMDQTLVWNKISYQVAPSTFVNPKIFVEFVFSWPFITEIYMDTPLPYLYWLIELIYKYMYTYIHTYIYINTHRPTCILNKYLEKWWNICNYVVNNFIGREKGEVATKILQGRKAQEYKKEALVQFWTGLSPSLSLY